ncbi:glycoside hydrolase family 16 protein [Mesorhizobium sp. WSM3626]|uniref:glycoside hydrolase family 16 protein n=1 Tax=Mesorhizobium sp. WSM3626 TaxID=1040987 RepID=UPI000687A6D5|nr:glycoside hydrolase family 16 protein [Mesorhizobium sp. WSM3626]
MALSAPTGFNSSNLVYEENFSDSALGSDWRTYITSNAAKGWAWNSNGSGGSTPGGPYNADYDMPSQVTLSNGVLDLTAVRQAISGVNQGGTTQTFPVTSGAVSSYGNVEFNGGYLQIAMKAPSGDGAWPGLWLMPGQGAGSSGDNFELDIQEGGFTGSGPADQNFSWHLHGPSGWVGGTIDSGTDLTAGFHTYGINWDPGKSITWYLDGKQMAQVTSSQVAIPDEPMQLMMNNGVANSNAAGWHTALNSSTPSSMQMQIDQVQLYQKAGSGDTVTGANVTPATTLTTEPAVTQVAASPATGIEHTDDSIMLTVGFNEAVTVTGTPSLSLNDGGKASYVSGSGTSALTFRTTVASTDTNTSALAITGVNLPDGASIKDGSGTAANLSGAVKTFSGLQVETSSAAPTTPVTPPSTATTTPPSTATTTPPSTATTTPRSIAPILTVADPTLDVNGLGGRVDLGVQVTTTDPNDVVTVNVTGLPKYETITDKFDGKMFSGNNITLTAAQVDSGLTLQSNYKGAAHPVATLTLTATAKDPVTGAVATASPQTMTITDPRPAATTTATSPQTITQADPQLAPTTSLSSRASRGSSLLNEHRDLVAGAARTLGHQGVARADHRHSTGSALLNEHRDRGASTVKALGHQDLAGADRRHATVSALPNEHRDRVAGAAKALGHEDVARADHRHATGTATASLASQSFALLNQYLAGHSGRVDPGQIVASLSNGTSWNQDSYLTRPHH